MRMFMHGLHTLEELDRIHKTWNWQDYFRSCKEDLKYYYGLELTIIEQVNLREIVKKCFDEQAWIRKNGDTRQFSGFDIDSEANARFLNDYYGVNQKSMRIVFSGLRSEQVKEYFRREQIKAHLP